MKITVVTGASSGIGKEFALQLDKEGGFDEIWLIARGEEKLKETASLLKTASRVLPLDLTDPSSFNVYETELKNRDAEVAYLVNASGYGKLGDSCTDSLDSQLGMIDLNVTALVKMTYITVKYMKEGGRIIELGSESTYNPLQHFAVYAASKSFVKFYSRAIARELKSKGITVTCVCPGWVKTAFFDRADIDVKSKNTFAKPMVMPDKVVARAIKDVKRGKDVSMYGAYNRFHCFLSKLLPHSALMNIWEKKYIAAKTDKNR